MCYHIFLTKKQKEIIKNIIYEKEHKENSLALNEKLKYTPTIRFTHSNFRYLPKRNESVCPQKKMTYGCSELLSVNIQSLQTNQITQMGINTNNSNCVISI